MGHFGRVPIRRAWFFVVFPALVINYLGQGALVLNEPGATKDPFFMLFPNGLQLPVVILATAATVIASQAVISGAFSLTRQAVQVGLLPPLTIRQTSKEEGGQIYLPAVNLLLFIGVMAIMLAFRSSAALTTAYGSRSPARSSSTRCCSCSSRGSSGTGASGRRSSRRWSSAGSS
nr:KUP/HAK/KT family potassium transporter [Frondihabitans sp. PAMC 28766]